MLKNETKGLSSAHICWRKKKDFYNRKCVSDEGERTAHKWKCEYGLLFMFSKLLQVTKCKKISHTKKCATPFAKMKTSSRKWNVTYGCHNIFLIIFFFYFFFSTCGTAKYIFFSCHSYKSYMCNRENIRPESGVVVLSFLLFSFFVLFRSCETPCVGSRVHCLCLINPRTLEKKFYKMPCSWSSCCCRRYHTKWWPVRGRRQPPHEHVKQPACFSHLGQNSLNHRWLETCTKTTKWQKTDAHLWEKIDCTYSKGGKGNG